MYVYVKRSQTDILTFYVKRINILTYQLVRRLPLPLKNGRLTPRERNAAAAYAATGDKQEAARRAGLAVATDGYRVLARPAVLEEVRRIQLERLNNEALPLAIDTLVACMRATDAPYAAKNQAAKITLEYTAGRDGSGASKEAHEMTASELDRRIAELEARKVELAQPVEAIVVDSGQAGVFE